MCFDEPVGKDMFSMDLAILIEPNQIKVLKEEHPFGPFPMRALADPACNMDEVLSVTCKLSAFADYLRLQLKMLDLLVFDATKGLNNRQGSHDRCLLQHFLHMLAHSLIIHVNPALNQPAF